MRACDSLGYLKLKQGMPSISDSSQQGSTVKLCLDFFLNQTVYTIVKRHYSKGTARCNSSCRASREIGNAGQRKKVRFKNKFKKNVSGGFFFFLPWLRHTVTQTVGSTQQIGFLLLAVPIHPPLHQLRCFYDSGLNCFCVKSAEN